MGTNHQDGTVMAEHLLVVEDDSTLRELLSASLRLAGFAVTPVTTGPRHWQQSGRSGPT